MFHYSNLPTHDVNIDTMYIVFEDFFDQYKLILTEAEQYLEKVIKNTDPHYINAYQTWRHAIHELLEGSETLSKKNNIENYEDFVEALHMFSFESTIKFLRDMCNMCDMRLKREWEKEFRERINQLLFSISTNNKKTQLA
ncbi:MAG: hypothetical protein R3D71_07475 [Rickettsiales bacterium]